VAHRIYDRSGGGVEFNMTPMIDVTFQLILFFILAGQIASEALAKMELAHPDVSQALKPKEADVTDKVIINVISRGGAGDREVDPFLAGQVAWYQVGTRRVEVGEEGALAEIIRERKADLPEHLRGEEFFVEIRADRRVQFGGVEPVLTASVEAGVSKMNITAIRDLGE